MLSDMPFGRKLRAFFIGATLAFCSMFVGNGFTPVFAVISLVEPLVSLFALGCYVLFSTTKCVVGWGVNGIDFSLILFQAVMMVIGYVPLLTLPLFRKFMKKTSFLAGLSLTIASALYYWWFSNSLCFTQMSGLIPSWKSYDFSLAGYLTCLVAGGSFFWHSIEASVPVFCALYFLGYFRILFLNESLSFAKVRA